MASPGAGGHDLPGGTRRSPPSESGEHRRRIRPRHSTTVSSPRGEAPPGGNPRPLSFSAVPSLSDHSPPSRDRYAFSDYHHMLRAQQREREWINMHMPRTGGRQSQPRAPPSMYHPYAWEEPPVPDSGGRLPMLASGGLPPMSGFSTQPSQQPSSLNRTAPGPHQSQSAQAGDSQGFSYFQSMGVRVQRETGAPGLSNPPPVTTSFNTTEANAPTVDTDIPMPDLDTDV